MTKEEACASGRHEDCDPLDLVGSWCDCSCHDQDEQA